MDPFAGRQILAECSEQLVQIFGVAPTSIEVERLQGNQWLTAGIWRIFSMGRSVILKRVVARNDGGRLTPWESHWTTGNLDPRHWNYWRRELLVYQSSIPGIFARFGVESPKLLAYRDTSDCIELWLEDCSRLTSALQWEADRYAGSARQLGIAQGAIGTRDLASDSKWLADKYLFEYSTEKPFNFEDATEQPRWNELPSTASFDNDLRVRLQRFVSSRGRLLKIASRVPQGICHNDFWTRNLFGNENRTVLIDWSFLGIGPIGSDIGNLIASAGFDGFVDQQNLASFASRVVDAYTDGLIEGGWEFDRELAQLGVWSSAVKYVWLVPATVTRAAEGSPPFYVGYGGADPVLYYSRVATTLDLLSAWAESAVLLAANLEL